MFHLVVRSEIYGFIISLLSSSNSFCISLVIICLRVISVGW